MLTFADIIVFLWIALRVIFLGIVFYLIVKEVRKLIKGRKKNG